MLLAAGPIILAGELKVLEPPDDLVFEKIKSYVDAEEFDGLKRAVVHDRSCSKAYRFGREVAIRWARARRGLFPDFPFPVDNSQLPSYIHTPDGGVSDELKRHRRTLIKRALDARDIDVTQTEFFKEHGIGEDTVRGIVNGQTSRYGEATKAEVLKLLGLTERDWNTLQ